MTGYLPAPSNPMAVARELITDYQSDGHLVLRRWRGSWMKYDTNHWTEAEDAKVRAWAYSRLEYERYLVDPSKVPPDKPWAPNKSKISNLTDALAAMTHLDGEIEPPAWLIDNPPMPAQEIVPCSNGLLHVTSRVLHRHTADYFSTVAVPYAYDPDVPKPEKWIKFLGELWPGEGGSESITALQQYMGYVLSGRVDLHKILLLVGPTRSGKGTIARVLQALVGKGNHAGPTLSSLGSNFGLQPLLCKPLAVVSDARLGGSNVH